MPKTDLTGHIFGRLFVSAFAGYPARHPTKAQWSCDCLCGQRGVVVFGYNLKNGNTTSCGCYRIAKTSARSLRHGHSKTNEYAKYYQIVGRCCNIDHPRWEAYGGRGIYICDRWLGESGFINFLSDMGPRPTKKHSVERRDNDGSYSPINCYWATAKEQGRNQRTNRVVEYAGRRWCLAELCEYKGIPYERTRNRLTLGHSIERAIIPHDLRRIV